MNVGVCIHTMVDYLSKFHFIKIGKVILCIIEIGSFTIPLCYSIINIESYWDFTFLSYMSVALIISFLHITPLDNFFDKHYHIPKKLGKFSVYIFLTHGFLVYFVIPKIISFFNIDNKIYIICIFIGLTIMMSLLIMIICKYITDKCIPKIKTLFIDNY